MPEFVITDDQGRPLEVGTRVEASGPGTITAISDPDADFDYELNRHVGISPKVTVEFDDGGLDEFPTNARMRPFEDAEYVCWDVLVLEHQAV